MLFPHNKNSIIPNRQNAEAAARIQLPSSKSDIKEISENEENYILLTIFLGLKNMAIFHKNCMLMVNKFIIVI